MGLCGDRPEAHFSLGLESSQQKGGTEAEHAHGLSSLHYVGCSYMWDASIRSSTFYGSAFRHTLSLSVRPIHVQVTKNAASSPKPRPSLVMSKQRGVACADGCPCDFFFFFFTALHFGRWVTAEISFNRRLIKND